MKDAVNRFRNHAELAKAAQLKGKILGANMFDYIVEPDGCVVLAKAYDGTASTKFTVPYFIDYIQDGAFSDTRFTEIHIDNSADSDFDSVGVFSKISSTSIKITFSHPEKVTTLNKMFAGANNLVSVDFGDAKFENVKDMEKMFYACNRLNTVDFSKFNPKNLVTTASMFEDCIRITDIDLSSFVTPQLNWAESMFEGCMTLKSVNLSGLITKNVESMAEMFSGCANLAQLNLSNFELRNGVDLTEMFYGCSSLKDIILAHTEAKKRKCQVITNNMFEQCYELESVVSSNADINDAFILKDIDFSDDDESDWC